MDGLLGQSDGLIRLAVFAGVFLVMAAIELLRPKRQLERLQGARAGSPISALPASIRCVLRLMAMLAVPLAAVAAAFFAKEHQLGLLNQVDWPYWLKVADRAARARPRHLGAASRLAQSADLLAAASGASRRPRHRRDHGGALSPRRDRALHAVEDRRGGPARRLALRGVPVRGDPQRLRHVQPRQHRAARVARPGRCGSSSSRRTCIACITRCCAASTIAITASTCRSGTGCSAPISPSRRPGSRA